MSYIGNQPTIGQYRKLDDISGSFNGSLTAFTMQVSSTNVTAGSAFQLLISLGGVIQEPGTDFTVSGSTITFTTAPAASLSFFGIMMGQPLNTATPGDSTVTGAKIVDGTITGAKLAAAFNYDSGLLFLDDTNNRIGIGTTSPSFKTEIVDTLQADANLNYSLAIRGDDSGTSGESAQIFLGAINATTRGCAIASILTADANAHEMAFKVSGSSATPTERMRIDRSGRLLINGTTSQTWSGGAPVLQVSGTSASGTMHLGAFQYSDSSDGGELVLGSSRGTTVGANTIVQNGDTLGRIRFCGADGVDFTNRGGEITCAVDGTPGSDDLPTRMIFYTASDGAGSPTERMRIQGAAQIVSFANLVRLMPQSDNSIAMGGPSNRWTAVFAVNGSIQTSDERQKTEVTESALGTEFVKSLRPVSYKWIEGGKRHTGEYDEDNNWVYESVPGQRTHWGFIAQEVKQAVDDAGVDFGGWVLTDKDDPDSEQALRYDQFIAPLTKALQEAIAKIETLETANASLEARLTALEGGTP